MDYKLIAQDIIKNVGGSENIQDVTHCFTRLRFVLKDNAKANKEVVERIEGVIQVVIAGGQFQVVIGSKVNKVYDEVLPLVNLAEGNEIKAEKGSVGNMILQTISKIFTPLVPAIAASGLIKGLLAVGTRMGWIDAANSTYIIMNAASNIIFYYMPVFLAYTASKTLKCNQVIAMVLGAFLCHPTIDALVQNVAEKSTIFGLPVIKKAFTIGSSTKVFAYAESVIPAILAVIVLSYLEKFLKKYIPDMLQLILVPGICLIVMVPVTLVVVGPVGIYVGYAIQWLYQSLYSFSPVLGGIIVGGLWGVFVIFGAHRALLPIGLNDVAISGTNTLLCFAGAANFAQAGATLGVMLKSKNQETKQVAAAAVIPAFLVGITEPAIYGCNLRLKKPMVCAVIAGAIGGAIMGLGHAVNTGFANNGILTIMTYYGEGTLLSQFIAYLIGICVAFLGAAALTYIVGFEDDAPKAAPVASNTNSDFAIASPIRGNAIALTEVKDQVFSSCAMGNGVAIEPTEGLVVAPEDCTVTMIYPTKHAIGLTLDSGVELIVHVGMNTVELNGEGFTQHVEQGVRVKKGETIVSFDIDALKAKGYDLTVPVVVANTMNFVSVEGVAGVAANENTDVIYVKR
ncbi:MAG: beta-glucoside-specific PTS transporter subunit IIABC [Erysipelotrichaceae bacterium]|nr:beta-glucoside-specific PTS transporter subunit IIABC [Erysipelotrichaceae bacterium]